MKIKKLINILLLLFIASNISAISAADKPSGSTQILEYDAVGRVPTMNNMGWMHPKIDPVTAQFIEFCKKTKEVKVLEIGAAYGYASEEALKNGAFVWINDLDVRHLDVFKQNIKDKSLLSRATLLPGDFPDNLKLEDNFYDAILAVRVMHFFEPTKLERAAEAAFKSLKIGGRIYIVAETPYLKNWAGYIPVYEKKKLNGDPYPGYFTNLSDYNKTASKYLPNALHFLDPEILTRVFTKAGFKVELAKFLNRTDFPDNMKLDGRESVGFIAIKL